MQNNPIKAKDMAQNARKIVVQEYNWKETQKKILQVLS
jgi:hypothetical protein